MPGANRRSRLGLASHHPQIRFYPVLTHMGAVRGNMLTGALVPRWGTVAGVPGPRRRADESDAGGFAPVATPGRPFLPARLPNPPTVRVPFRPCRRVLD